MTPVPDADLIFLCVQNTAQPDEDRRQALETLKALLAREQQLREEADAMEESFRAEIAIRDRQVQQLREALIKVRRECLLSIRRAAFAPEIGVRYTEKIRLAIADECFRLETFIDEALAAGRQAEPEKCPDCYGKKLEGQDDRPGLLPGTGLAAGRQENDVPL